MIYTPSAMNIHELDRPNPDAVLMTRHDRIRLIWRLLRSLPQRHIYMSAYNRQAETSAEHE